MSHNIRYFTTSVSGKLILKRRDRPKSSKKNSKMETKPVFETEIILILWRLSQDGNTRNEWILDARVQSLRFDEFKDFASQRSFSTWDARSDRLNYSGASKFMSMPSSKLWLDRLAQ